MENQLEVPKSVFIPACGIGEVVSQEEVEGRRFITISQPAALGSNQRISRRVRPDSLAIYPINAEVARKVLSILVNPPEIIGPARARVRQAQIAVKSGGPEDLAENLGNVRDVSSSTARAARATAVLLLREYAKALPDSKEQEALKVALDAVG